MISSFTFSGDPKLAALYCEGRNDYQNLKVLVAELHASTSYVNMRTVYRTPYIIVVLDDHPFDCNHDQPAGRRSFCDVYLVKTPGVLEETFETPEEFYAWVLARFW